jgi:hypothetical protein
MVDGDINVMLKIRKGWAVEAAALAVYGWASEDKKEGECVGG